MLHRLSMSSFSYDSSLSLLADVAAPDTKASIYKWSGGEAEVQYNPTVTEQIQMAELFRENPESGLNGYLAISYDVLSPSLAGQLLVSRVHTQSRDL